jgi:hypothetical protein
MTAAQADNGIRRVWMPRPLSVTPVRLVRFNDVMRKSPQPSSAYPSPSKAAWIAGVSSVPLGVIMALGPLVYLACTANPVDFAPEFVYYRIGDALSLLNGEGIHVHPAQGLPTALLSKALTWLIGERIVERPGLQLYGQAWIAAIAGPVLWAAWRSARARIALAMPLWCGTAAIGLIVAPEYWQG